MVKENIVSDVNYKEIPEFPSYYVGENGSVMRYRNNKFNPLKISHDIKNKVTYMLIQNKKGKWRSIRPYMFIAKIFVKNPSPNIFNSVGYYDGDETNISANNLYWKARANRKLSPKAVKYIKYSIENNTHTNVELASMFGVSDMQISRIKSGENWGKGKFIRKNKLPFDVNDGKIRRFLTTFDIQKRENYKMKFKVKKTDTKLRIVGIVNGYLFSLKHSNITRATKLTNKLNTYFYGK
jgi:hypothetical protein